jgi:hypothetical protein
MLKNHSMTPAPSVNKLWLEMSDDERYKLIFQELKKSNKIKNFEIFRVPKDGKIILKTEISIKSSERGMLLLDIEEQLKKNIDKGLTIWLEPVGDKSKLRNLRGIVFKRE